MSRRSPGTSSVGNPWLRVDLRTRLRANTAPALLSGWALVVAGSSAIVLLHLVGTDDPTARSLVSAARLGRAVGEWWVITCTIGLSLLGVASGAQGFAEARERHTFTSWRATALRPRQFVMGSAVGMAAFVTLAAVVAAPAGVLAWRLGGASPKLLAVALGVSWLVGVVSGCVGLTVSAMSRRSGRALAVGVLLVALPFVVPTAIHALAHDHAHGDRPDRTMVANPVVLVAVAATAGGESSHPTATAADAPLSHLAAIGGGSDPDASRTSWIAGLGGAVALGVVCLLAAGWKLRRVPKR